MSASKSTWWIAVPAVRPEAEHVAGADRQLAERFDELVAVADDLEDVGVEVDVVDRGADGPPHERRLRLDDDFGQVLLDGVLLDVVVLDGDAFGDEAVADGHEIEAAGDEDDDAEGGKLEHGEGVAEQPGRHVAGEDVRRGADEGEHPAEHRGIGEG